MPSVGTGSQLQQNEHVEKYRTTLLIFTRAAINNTIVDTYKVEFG